MEKTEFKSVDEYIHTFPEEVQEKLENIRDIIRKKVPNVQETISYGMPTFTLAGSYLIYLAAWKNHISIYPISSKDKELYEELSSYLSGKGTAKFLLKNPIPYDLIEKIVESKLKEHQKKTK